MTVTESVLIASPRGEVRYEDTEDHFRNGVLRLLNLDEDAFREWLRLAEEAGGEDLLERLAAGWAALKPLARPEGVPASGPVQDGGRLLHAAIAESPGWGVAVDDDERHGWLVRWDGERFARESEPPVYEEEYFEGDKLSAGGYGDYTAQAGWRLEKAHRQVREMRDLTGVAGGRVLDIGCGYGYFRVALAEAGYEHDGLEVSAFARAVAKETYGHETFGGFLDDHWRDWGERYDAIVLFDLIEHLADPDAFLRQVHHCLAPGGVVGIKTPNLTCPEATVFGPWYHSLKREHLQFFSSASLTAAAARAGLQPAALGSISHLLSGFVGRARCEAWEHEGLGADLASWYRRPA